MIKILGYARVSTLGQDLDAQLAAADVDPPRLFHLRGLELRSWLVPVRTTT
jgi:hypothetical protein